MPLNGDAENGRAPRIDYAKANPFAPFNLKFRRRLRGPPVDQICRIRDIGVRAAPFSFRHSAAAHSHSFASIRRGLGGIFRHPVRGENPLPQLFESQIGRASQPVVQNEGVFAVVTQGLFFRLHDECGRQSALDLQARMRVVKIRARSIGDKIVNECGSRGDRRLSQAGDPVHIVCPLLLNAVPVDRGAFGQIIFQRDPQLFPLRSPNLPSG